MFNSGIRLMMFAAGCSAVFARLTGDTVRLLGAMPALDFGVVPSQTCYGIGFGLSNELACSPIENWF
jgi:hypothetical protein